MNADIFCQLVRISDRRLTEEKKCGPLYSTVSRNHRKQLGSAICRTMRSRSRRRDCSFCSLDVDTTHTWPCMRGTQKETICPILLAHSSDYGVPPSVRIDAAANDDPDIGFPLMIIGSRYPVEHIGLPRRLGYTRSSATALHFGRDPLHSLSLYFLEGTKNESDRIGSKKLG